MTKLVWAHNLLDVMDYVQCYFEWTIHEHAGNSKDEKVVASKNQSMTYSVEGNSKNYV